MPGMFTPEFLIESAARLAETSDFGDPLYLEPLRTLIGAIEHEAMIEPQRAWRTAAQFMALLATRARVADLLRRHPEINDVEVREPVFVTGLLRTGTTMLHNMLAGHPEHRSPRLWQLRAPVRPEGADEAWERAQIAETRSVLEVLYSTVPEFKVIHPMNELWPDECSWLFRHNFASLVYAFTYHVPSYVTWLGETDMAPYYASYKQLLQIMIWQGASGRLVMKDPCHIWHLDALLKVFPDARVVMLHRDVAEALPSMASLCFALQRVESGRGDPAALGPYCSDLAERGLYSMMWLRQAMRTDRVLDVRYRDLVAAPGETARSICAWAGSDASDRAVESMTGWLAENRQHKAGKHRYALADFGMNERAIADRFARYEDAYLKG